MASTLISLPSESFSLSPFSPTKGLERERGNNSYTSSMWGSLSAIRASNQNSSPFSVKTGATISPPGLICSNGSMTVYTNGINTGVIKGQEEQRESANSVVPQGGCLLKKLDPNIIVQQYFSGLDIEIPKTKYQLFDSVAKLKPKIPTDTTADIYRENDTGGAHLACSSNRNAFVAFIRSVPTSETGGCCIWCRRNCSWDMMGIPTDLKPLKLSTTFGPQVNKRYEVSTELITCSFECTLAQYDYMALTNIVDLDPLFFNSKAIILFLFKEMYPGEELKAAPHYTLLQHNGGSLSTKDFFSGEHRWIRTGNVVPIPRQVVYIDGSSI